MVNEIVSRMIADGFRGGFTILQEYNDNLRRRLQLNQLDLYIAMITGREDPDEFRTDLVFVDRIVCACRADHPILSGPISSKRLLEFSWIAHEDGEIGRVMIEGFFRGQQLETPSVAITTNVDKTLRHFLRTADVIAVVPEVILKQPGYEGILKIPWRRLSFKRKVGLVTRVGPSFSLTVDEFIRRLRTNLGAFQAGVTTE
jgi:DNA-binding transcriptional LysR family regulator